MAGLNPRQRRFIENYTVGPEGVRGNATASYYASGYNPRNNASARAAAAQLLANINVAAEIERIYRERDNDIIAQMEDWKLHAPRAQRRILALAIGLLPQGTMNAGGEITGIITRRVDTAHDRHLARMLADVNFKIIERAYPPRAYDTLETGDPMDELAKLIGWRREDMPSVEDLMDGDHLSVID